MDEVVSKVGSGMNGRRPKLARILRDSEVGVIVVEHRDRLARFGVENLEAALVAHGRRITVVEQAETTDDLVQDMVEVLTWNVCPVVRAAWRAEPGHACGHHH